MAISYYIGYKNGVKDVNRKFELGDINFRVNNKIEKAYAVVSRKSNNITKYNEICNSFVIFPTRNSAEVLIRHWIKKNTYIKNTYIPWVVEEVEIIRA